MNKNKIVVFIVIFALISTIISGYGFILYKSIKESFVNEVGARAQGTANTVAMVIEQDIDNYKSLTDISRPYDGAYYNKMLFMFQELKSQSDSNFLYTVNYVSENQIEYVLDGEDPNRESFSMLGITDHMSEPMRQTFNTGLTHTSGIIKDGEWGSYLTATAPILDKDKTIVGLVCVDYSLKYIESTIMKCIITLIIISISLSFIFSVIATKLIYEKFSAKSIDYLTGLYSRSYLDLILPKLIKKSIKDNKPLSLIMIDIDYFKGLNDTYGHAYGDKVLVAVAETINKCTRSQDICIRQSGDEFIVVFPELEKKETLMISQRILKKTREIQINGMDINTLKITLSIGISEWKKQMSAKDLIESADKMLYASKNSGRNKYSA